MIVELIKPTIDKELSRNIKMLHFYENEIKSLPKGNISIKKVNSNSYYYLKYRKDTKIITDYIGKDKLHIKPIEEQIEKRKHYQKMLSALLKEQKEIKRIIRVLS
ncbi:MAG: hypothetical protein KAQ69_08975 [Spirochaetales bacterium]|nr:hypothetical protein [Spirochaetales bacterium]